MRNLVITETDNFEYLKRDEKKLIIAFFHASWCGPCQRLSPIIDELADEYAGKVDIYKENVDDEEPLAKIFKVRSIPTLVYIPKGDVPTVQAGGKSKAELKELIDSILLK